ncbi:MAG: DNA recombination protein RmuC [Sphingomonas sp.]|nr:DNA recombination protein RmuC [Sphingomonas sp.]
MLAIVLIVAALVGGLAIGWRVGRGEAASARAERDKAVEDFRRAITDLAAASERAKATDVLATTLERVRGEREAALTQIATLTAESAAFEARLTELREAKEAMGAQFAEVSGKLLNEAQELFLKRADERFRQSEEVAGQNLRSMLAPVSERLSLYEETVKKVETERASAFDQLKGELQGLRVGQERVSSEAARLVNALRNAPKARGRWGEQQLRNVLETCGLSEHADFQTEVSVSGEDGRLRPDVIIRIPGGRLLVVDAKVSLNAYQDAFEAEDEGERIKGLAAHAGSMRAHAMALGNKSYEAQFKEAVDFVVMFVPGEHFVSAALEQDPKLWDDAFAKKVLIATPTNLVAIARTIAAVWRQENLARQAAEIGRLGKELYERLAKVAEDMNKVGRGLNSAVGNFNAFANSFNGRLVVTGKKFRDLDIETGTREIEEVAHVEALARVGDTPLLFDPQGADD